MSSGLLLRAIERANARDRALVVMLLFTALRISEVVALDVEDLRISPRKGVVVVRSGKGDVYRDYSESPAQSNAGGSPPAS